MVGKFSSSAKLGIYLPKFHWQFKDYIPHVARLYFSCGLVFNRQKMSVMHNLDNSVSGPLLEIPFAGLFVLKICPISYFKRGWCPSRVFCAVLKQFSSNVFLEMANVSQCTSRFSIPESGSPKNCCMGSSS